MPYRIDQSSLFRISATNLSKGVASNETSARGVATKAAMYITARLAMGMFSAAATGGQIPRINSNLWLPHGYPRPTEHQEGLPQLSSQAFPRATTGPVPASAGALACGYG